MASGVWKSMEGRLALKNVSIMAEGFRQVLIQLIQPRLPFLVGCGGSCHRNGVRQVVIKAVPTFTDIWVWYNDVGQVVSCQVKGFAGGSACNLSCFQFPQSPRYATKEKSRIKYKTRINLIVLFLMLTTILF